MGIYRLKVLGTLGMVELPPVVRETDLAGEREDMSDVNLSVVEQALLRKVGIHHNQCTLSFLSPSLSLTHNQIPRETTPISPIHQHALFPLLPSTFMYKCTCPNTYSVHVHVQYMEIHVHSTLA